MVQLDMTSEVEPCTNGASMDTPFKHDTDLNFDYKCLRTTTTVPYLYKTAVFFIVSSIYKLPIPLQIFCYKFYIINCCHSWSHKYSLHLQTILSRWFSDTVRGHGCVMWCVTWSQFHWFQVNLLGTNTVTNLWKIIRYYMKLKHPNDSNISAPTMIIFRG